MKWDTSKKAFESLGCVWCTAVLVLGLLPVIVGAQSPGTPAGFEIDGTQVCQDNAAGTGAGDDWADGNACDGVVDPPAGFTGSQFTDCNWGNQGDKADSTQFKGNSNKNTDLIGAGEEPWNWASQGGGPQKNDITNVYVHRRMACTDPVTGDTAGLCMDHSDCAGNDACHEWLFVGAETRSTNGDSHIDFEVNQAGVQLEGGFLAPGCEHDASCCDLNPDEEGNIVGNGPDGGRTVNDLIVSVDFIQGGVQPILSVRAWDGAQFVPAPAVEGVSIFSQTNTSDTPSGNNWTGFKSNGSSTANIAALQFVEGAIDVTALEIELSPCMPLATLMVKTRSSQSFTAELKDFALFPFPVPPTPTCIPEDDEVCADENAQLCATIDSEAGNLTAPFTMVWKDPSGAILETYNGLMDGDERCIDILSASAADAGQYTVEITDVRECDPEVCNPVLTVNPNPVADAGPDQAECEFDGMNPTLGGSPTASGGTPGYAYAWSGDRVKCLSDTDVANPTFDIGCARVGVHTLCVEVTDSNGCKDNDCVDVEVYDEPVADAGPDQAECEFDGMDPTLGGSPTASGGTPGRRGYTYEWTGAQAACLDATDVANPTFDLDCPGAAGVYTLCVEVTDANGCKDDDCVDVEVYDEPTCTVQPALVCTGEEMCAIPSGGAGGGDPNNYTYAWSTGETTQCITPTMAGIQSVTVTDANGCYDDCQGQAEDCGVEACSPGFWKNHPEEWCAYTPFDPGQGKLCGGPATTFLGAFELGKSCDGAPNPQENAIESGLTLFEAVNTSGGPNQTLFHCSAALLSAESMNFPASATEVRQTVQNACSGSISWSAAFNACASWNAAEYEPGGCCPFSNCP